MIQKRRSVKNKTTVERRKSPVLENLPDLYPEVKRGVFSTPTKEGREPHTKTFGASPKSSPKVKKTPVRASPKKVDYGKMTVAQLKAVLRKGGKPVSGKKADLIKRLEGGEKMPKEAMKKSPAKATKEVDYGKMTVAQLKVELRKAGKPVSGKKADLIKRLGEGKEPVGKSPMKGKNYQKMTVVQLKVELKKAGKPVSGKKADLIKRLQK